MQFSFRYTDDEYLETRRLNKLTGMPRWKSYALSALCLLPSFGLILLTQSMVAILAASALMLAIVALSIMAFSREKLLVDKHEHFLKLDPFSKHELQSHSEFETRWDYYDEYQEVPSYFLFRRLERFTAIPKRVISDQDLGEFQSYCEQVRQSTGADDEQQIDDSANDTPAVPLYHRLFPAPIPPDVFTFSYLADDLQAAVSDPLKPIEESNILDPSQNKSPSQPRTRQKMFGIFWLAVFLTSLFYATSAIPNGAERWTTFGIALLVAAIILPFILIKLVNAIYRARVKKSQPKVPRDQNSMRLLENGWAIGNPKSCQFFDWRDVHSFYQNKFCFGFRTFNDLVQVIPKRIFSDTQQAETFLNRAISFRREHLRSFEEKTVGIETGNPYQPPTS